MDAFSLEKPELDFVHFAQAYGWNYARIETEGTFKRALADVLAQNGDNTLLEIRLDPEAVPITASEHF